MRELSVATGGVAATFPSTWPPRDSAPREQPWRALRRGEQQSCATRASRCVALPLTHGHRPASRPTHRTHDRSALADRSRATPQVRPRPSAKTRTASPLRARSPAIARRSAPTGLAGGALRSSRLWRGMGMGAVGCPRCGDAEALRSARNEDRFHSVREQCVDHARGLPDGGGCGAGCSSGWVR